MNSKAGPTLTLKGIVRRNSSFLTEHNFRELEVKVSFLLLPAWRLVRKWNVRDPLRAMSGVLRLKKFFILISRVQVLFLGFRWKSISIELDFQEFTDGAIQHRMLDWVNSNRVYIAREIGFIGFHLNKFDLSLEYDLLRFLNRYEIILTSAIIGLQGVEFKTGETLAQSKISMRNSEIIKVLNSTYIPVAMKNSSSVPRLNASLLQSSLVEIGELSRLDSSDSLNLNNGYPQSCWRYREFLDATAFHGLLVRAEKKFYLSDPKRHSIWGSEFNLIPGAIFQGSDGNWMTPKPLRKPDKIVEAIFIGGTNNLMHTVLEDLSRVVFAELLGIDRSVPIVISSLLSPQIVSLLANVSGRQVITRDLYSQTEIAKLHFFEFDSPLPSIMAGVYRLRGELFPSFIAQNIQETLAKRPVRNSETRRRILILRERGLFRPITNLERVKKLLIGEFGFEAHFLSEMSFEVVAALFSQSSIVVGEYGAGLANSIHMHSGTKVLEIRGPLEVQACEYEILVSALGLNHSLLVGQSRILSKYGISRGPYAVPIGTLRGLLIDLMGD